MPTLGKTIFELSRIFRLLNEHYFGGTLNTPVIAVQTQGKQSAYGWCSSRPVWNELKKGVDYYEITMTAEYLTRSNEDIVATLLHEMVHLYCGQNGIKDTSRSGTYHNEKFKNIAETVGLIIEKDSKIGWSLTSLNSDAVAFIPSLKINRQAFRIARQVASSKGKGKTKQSMRKYICPECGMTVRATKTVNVMCGDCLCTMTAESED